MLMVGKRARRACRKRWSHRRAGERVRVAAAYLGSVGSTHTICTHITHTSSAQWSAEQRLSKHANHTRCPCSGVVREKHHRNRGILVWYECWVRGCQPSTPLHNHNFCEGNQRGGPNAANKLKCHRHLFRHLGLHVAAVQSTPDALFNAHPTPECPLTPPDTSGRKW